MRLVRLLNCRLPTTMRRMLTTVANHCHATRRAMLALDETLLDRCQRFHRPHLRSGEKEFQAAAWPVAECRVERIVVAAYPG
jgi:hypothetical protein